MLSILRNIIRTATVLGLLTGFAAAQLLMLSPQDNSVSRLHHISVTVAGKPGAVAKLFVNEELAASGKIRVDGIFDFLNVEVPSGPVTLKAEAEGALGRIYSASRNVHILGTPARLEPFQSDIRLEADGFAVRQLKFEIRDEWDYNVSFVKYATVSLTSGRIMEADLDTAARAVQLPVDDGLLAFTVQAPAASGRAILEIIVGDAAEQYDILYTTPQEPFILVGSIDGRGKAYTDDGGSTPSSLDKDMDKDYSGRTAFYGSGGIGGQYRLTASYDSDREYYDQVFEDVDPNEPYPIYGDASTILYDAQSKSKFYAKLERNDSYLLLGDYSTGFNAAEFAAYDRSFNGLLLNGATANHSLKGFASLSDLEMTLDEIRGQGISGYYYTTRSNITRFSEKVRIETRDKYHYEKVLRSDVMTRYQDYDINYIDGTLMFKQPVPSIDPNGNPVSIVIAYENRTSRKESLIGGFRYEGKFRRNLALGTTLVLEEQSQDNYLLYGIDARLPLTDWLSLRGEFAASETPVQGNSASLGSAYKLETLFNPFSALSIEGYYRNVDSSFVNKSQGGQSRELGSEKYGAKSVYRGGRFGDLTAEYYHQNTATGSVNEEERQVASIIYGRQLGQRSRLNLGYEGAERKRQRAAQGSFGTLKSDLLKGDISYQLNERIAALVEQSLNLSETDRSKPNSSSLGLEYKLSEKLRLFTKYRLLSGEGKRSQAILGFDSQVRENTQLTGKYEIGSSIGDDHNRASIGLKNKWQVRDDLTVNLSYENTSTIDSLAIPAPDHQSLSTALEFLPDRPFKLTGKYEVRLDQTTRKQGVTFGSDFRILGGLSSLTKLNYYQTEYLSGSEDITARTDFQSGLALRPVKSDAFNGLAKVAYISDRNDHVDPVIRLDRYIVSLHAYWQPLAWLEFGGRYATRQILDEEGDIYSHRSRTDFYSLRSEFDMSLNWSAALDLRFLEMEQTSEILTGTAVELNYLLMKNTQVGIGYVLSSFDDPDFAFRNYQVQNIYLTFHLKFSEDIFNWR